MSFKMHLETQRNFENAKYACRQSFQSIAWDVKTNDESKIPTFECLLDGGKLSIWDEKARETSSFNWMIDFSKSRVMCEGHSGCKDNQLILHDNFVVLNTVRDMTQIRQFASNALVVAKNEDGKSDLVNLWHQFPSDESIRWWAVVIGKCIYRIERSVYDQGCCSLEILNLESGEREKMFQFQEEFNGEVEKDLAYNQKWIVIPFEHQTLILDIERSKIKYLEKAKGMFSWYKNQFAIKDDRIFAVCVSGSVPIWDAKTGKIIVYADSFTGPEKQISVSGSDVIVCTPMEVVVYRESEEHGLVMVSEKDLTSLGLEYLSFANINEDLESGYGSRHIHRLLIGVKMIQNVLAICYIIIDENVECYIIKVAFLPMRLNKGGKLKEAFIYRGYSMIRPEQVAFHATTTSLIVNLPVFRTSFVLDFFNQEGSRDLDSNKNISSNPNPFYFPFKDDVPDW